jgi:tetratricopeptide (TPR) repeat protein
MWHYARGIAYARKHQFEEAEQELQKLVANKTNPQLKESPSSFNAGLASLEVAEKVLQGVIAEEKDLLPAAITHFKDAVDKEDGMLYNEPKDWLLPVRQYLGHALLNAKQYLEAEKVYKEDLMANPNNGWSLTGLEKALMHQNKKKEAVTVQQQIRKAFARTDTQITSSVF